jgi:predicted TIM-barrel fold metal-dependent hydrolase
MLPHKRCVDELRDLPLKDEVKEKWLGGNAARLLGLEKK